MPVVSSTYTADAHTQADGRRYVTERHVDSAGVEHLVMYLAPAEWGAAEYQAMMDARVAQIDSQLAAAEFDRLLNEDV